MQRARIAIVGAGPAGLTAALVAKKLALETLVFEQAPDFQRIGGGIALQSNGLRVLDTLDLLESFRPAMRLSEVAVVELPGGRRLGVYDGRKLSIPQNHLAVVLRYRLQEHLLAAAQGEVIRIEFDRRCTAARVEGGRAVLRFADGREEQFDIVIGADGIHSSIRVTIAMTNGTIERPSIALGVFGPLSIEFGLIEHNSRWRNGRHGKTRRKDRSLPTHRKGCNRVSRRQTSPSAKRAAAGKQSPDRRQPIARLLSLGGRFRRLLECRRSGLDDPSAVVSN